MPTITDTITNEYTVSASNVREGDVIIYDGVGSHGDVSRVENGTQKTKIWLLGQTKQGPTFYVNSDEEYTVYREEPTEAASALRMIELTEQLLVNEICADIGAQYKDVERMHGRLAKGQHAVDWGSLTNIIEHQAKANAWWYFIRVAQNVGSITEAAVIVADEFKQTLLDTSALARSTNPASNLLDAETHEAKRLVLTRSYYFSGIVRAQRTLTEGAAG